MRPPISLPAGLICALLFAGIAAAQTPSPLELGMLENVNQFRADPAAWADVLKRERSWYRGNLLHIPGGTPIATQEGLRALNEAIAALESERGGLSRLTPSPGLSRAAADHVRDTGGRGLFGHKGADGSAFNQRIDRYGTWSGSIAENIVYGMGNARAMLVQQIVDDSVKDRGHRLNLLNPAWRYVGIACGHHKIYGEMCVLDFAAGFQEATVFDRFEPGGRPGTPQ